MKAKPAQVCAGQGRCALRVRSECAAARVPHLLGTSSSGVSHLSPPCPRRWAGTDGPLGASLARAALRARARACVVVRQKREHGQPEAGHGRLHQGPGAQAQAAAGAHAPPGGLPPQQLLQCWRLHALARLIPCAAPAPAHHAWSAPPPSHMREPCKLSQQCHARQGTASNHAPPPLCAAPAARRHAREPCKLSQQCPTIAGCRASVSKPPSPPPPHLHPPPRR